MLPKLTCLFLAILGTCQTHNVDKVVNCDPSYVKCTVHNPKPDNFHR